VRLRWILVVFWGIVGAAGLIRARRTPELLTVRGAVERESEAIRADRLLASRFSRPFSEFFAVTMEGPRPFTTGISRAALDSLARDLRAEPYVRSLLSFGTTGDSIFLSSDARRTFLLVSVDQPGGDSLGPSPYELLLWALGSCTAMTLLMYARRKGWDLAEVSVHLTHDRVHAEDSQDAESEGGKVELITRDISLRGDLSQEQQQRLMEIAGRCPVHKTLTGSPQVIDTIISGA